MVWFTDERRIGPLSEIFNIANYRHAASRIWTCAEPQFRLRWMKLCSSDNHYAQQHILTGIQTIGNPNLLNRWSSKKNPEKRKFQNTFNFFQKICGRLHGRAFWGIPTHLDRNIFPLDCLNSCLSLCQNYFSLCQNWFRIPARTPPQPNSQ